MSRKVLLSSILQEVSSVIETRNDAEISGVTADSRQVRPGDLFVAYRGFEHDGHDFIPSALASGAAAIVFDEPERAAVLGETAWARVEDARRAAAEIAATYYEHPSREMLLAGVTGTNGKTTTSYLIEAILAAADMRTGVIGTLGYKWAGSEIEAARTTPDAIELQSLLRNMADDGVQGVAMEVSSHGLALDRAWRCAFDVVIFTNLSQDHYDFHSNAEEYFEAKARLFVDYPGEAAPHKEMCAAINLDDPFGRRLAGQAACEVIGYGLSPDCEVRADDLTLSPAGACFRLLLPGAEMRLQSKLPARFNVYNSLAAAAAAHAVHIEPAAIKQGLESFTSVPGRFERVDAGQPYLIIVDYAHSESALSNVLSVARQMGPSRLICVFGCGGDRDADKRPKMGRIATQLADFTIITSDNPRSERPLEIIAQIRAGVVGDAFTIEADRRQAIRMALEMAQPDDLVLIAGKGHETYQIFANNTVPFDDRQVARELVHELKH